MGIRAQGNPLASFADLWSNTGLDAVNPSPSGGPGGHTASGGVISDWVDPSPGKVYRTHIFTSSGTFVVTSLATDYPADCEYLVVAGGGCGGYEGGGGAGGLRTNLTGHPLATNNPSFTASVATYPISVGAGAANVAAGPTSSPNNGTPSFIGPSPTKVVESTGGGGSANYPSTPGRNGGSAGGGSSTPTTAGFGRNPTTPGPAGGPFPHTEGYPGGSGVGGGGGAGGAGNSGSPFIGGPGVQVLIAGASTATGVGALNPGPGQYQWFAGGGSGAPSSDPSSVAGGVGGGGKGGYKTEPGKDGQQSTGGGGGGRYTSTSTPATGNGGSGFVAVRYQIGTTEPDAKATGGAISKYDDKWIHTFVSSGTFATGPTWTSATVEYVVVAGGGGGGGHIQAGGGGAGGYRTGTTPIGAHPVSTTITVGAGGLGGEANPVYATGNDGSASLFGSPIPAAGGGGGGVYPTNNAHSGASGGGSGGASSPVTGGAATGDPFPGTIGATPANGWGHPGGDGLGLPAAPAYGPAGGGGAGAAGSNGSSTVTTAGKGGAGIQLPATFRDPVSGVGAPGPTSAPTPNGFDTSGKYWVAGGGGGTGYNPAEGSALGVDGAPGGASPGGNTPYAGGGGGAGDNSGYTPAGGRGAPGWANTGGGGGGAERLGPGNGGGQGGSGIVIIAYPA